jgi:hypothetical protein
MGVVLKVKETQSRPEHAAKWIGRNDILRNRRILHELSGSKAERTKGT